MMENEKMDNSEAQLVEINELKQSLDDKEKNAKKALRTGTVVITALLVLIILAIAWFFMNNWVRGAGSAISASGEYRFSLATLESDSQGVYDDNDKQDSSLAKALSRFWRADRNGRDDDEGNHYKSFIDLPDLREGTSKFTKDGVTYILGDSEGISLNVNSESNVNNTREFDYIEPGSYGKITFYIIPHVDNLGKVKVSVSLKPFTLVREGAASDNEATGKAVPIEDVESNRVLLDMLKGHFLLFEGTSHGDYTSRILPVKESNGTISFSLERNSDNAWTKDQPEPVTVYWIWPRRFENIKYCGQEDSVFKNECDCHIQLLEWINGNRDCVVNTNEILNTTALANPTEDMNNAQLSQWSSGYNKGDQLIGENIAFFQWIIEAE